MASQLDAGAVRVQLPDLVSLVANCGEIDRAEAQRFVEKRGDLLMLTLEVAIVELLAGRGLLAQHVAEP